MAGPRQGVLAGRHAVVIGGSVGGLAAARVLTDRGARVTVLDRDPEEPPAELADAFNHWRRRTIPHLRHSHIFLGRLRNLLRDHYSDLLTELLAHGAQELRRLDYPPVTMPPFRAQPGDDDLVSIGCRRTTFEWLLQRRIFSHPHVTLHRDAHVTGLVATTDTTVPTVRGVRYTHHGKATELSADFVVDASGRASEAPHWLATMGRRVYEEQESSGIIYYTRFYRLRSPLAGKNPRPMTTFGDHGLLKFSLFPADDETFSVTLTAPEAAPELKSIVQVPTFVATAAAIPEVSPWVSEAVAESIDPSDRVHSMGGLTNRLRRFVNGREALAPGFFAVGDAAYCSNPLYGRGCAQAFLHAHLLGQALDRSVGDLGLAAVELDRLARSQIEPFYRASVQGDRAIHWRFGGAPPSLPSRLRRLFIDRGVRPTTRKSPAAFRAYLRMYHMLEPPELAFRRPAIILLALGEFVRTILSASSVPPGPGRS